LELFSKFEEQIDLIYLYYGIDNIVLKESVKINPDKKNIKAGDYFSIKDIEESKFLNNFKLKFLRSLRVRILGLIGCWSCCYLAGKDLSFMGY
jgi:hypothetical protein